MKKLGLFGIIGIVLIIIIAAVTAGKMGETSHSYARGQVVLAPELADKAAGIETLFVIAARNQAGDRPMPLGALKKTLGGSYPGGGALYDFVLTNESMIRMDMNAPFPAQFKLKARLDRDGTAGPDQPGDLVGEVNPVSLGAENVVIKIDRVVP